MPDDPDLYDRAARAALQNARNHLASAEAVASTGQFGAARSLVLVGMEETAKATEFKAIAFGLATTNQSEAEKTGKRYIPTWQFRNHVAKSFRFSTIAYAGALIEAVAPGFEAIATGREPTAIDEGIMSSGVERFVRILDSVDEMPREREDGFYVDVRDAEMVSPATVTREEYDLRAADLRYCVDTAEQWVSVDRGVIPEYQMVRLRPLLRRIDKIEESKIEGYHRYRKSHPRLESHRQTGQGEEQTSEQHFHSDSPRH